MKNQILNFYKNQNAITLVSLVITIIVMLILAGVSVDIALNGGLFRVAEEATKGTEKQLIFNQILNSIVRTHSGQIDINTTYQIAKSTIKPQVKSVSEITDGVFSVEGNSGTYTFTITEDEIILGLEENDDIVISPAINDFEIEVVYDSTAATLTITPTDSNVETISNFSTYEATNKILKINGIEVSEGISWNGNTAVYTVPDNNVSNIAGIQLELDDYVGEGRILPN